MSSFINVKFEMIKEKLAEGILKNICIIVETYKVRFLNDILLFNSSLSFSSTINFFNSENVFQLHGTINFNPLNIEDFLYRSLEEIMFEIEIFLIHKLNKIEEKYFFNEHNLKTFDVIHTTNVNFIPRETYFKQ